MGKETIPGYVVTTTNTHDEKEVTEVERLQIALWHISQHASEDWVRTATRNVADALAALREEINEALQLTESCSSLKEMAACVIEGAALREERDEALRNLRIQTERVVALEQRTGTVLRAENVWLREERDRLREALLRPITWPEIRLAVGEGRLEAADTLAGVHAELRRRADLAAPSNKDGVGGQENGPT